MAFLEVDESDFQQVMAEEFKKKSIVILKFTSEYCDACHALEGELEDVDESNENISILSIECSESPSIAEHYHIYTLPTMLIYKDENNLLYRGEGVVLSQDIEEIIF